ncbi:COG4223 family protein [Phenylobacterium soli]|uniref:Uncharacterized protein n=1 Tax=Phenylobacterium soli TaxID=2170551 RepID=A0A328AFD7_9CAUL|nr:mitofilin family membrane protein [Phenylobacterium soli]RAK53452.1 hypothetical protein DJ017_02375 [Phenylobacterium soli]
MSPRQHADVSAPKDPAEYRPRALKGGVSPWAVLVLSLACLAAGMAVATFAPKYFATRPAARQPEAPPAPEPLHTLTVPAAPEAITPQTTVPALVQAPQLERLEGRVTSLEAQANRANHAAAAALAAAALVEASQGSRPFPEEAAALRAVSPDSPELGQLTRLAAAGAPSRESLTASFPDYAARAASAARKPGEGAPLSDRIAYYLSQVVMVRRVGDVAGEGPDAQLARAERSVEDGDFDRAFAALDKLPPAARDAMAPWRTRAERRAEVDRLAASLRARALAELAAVSRSGA